MIAVCNTQKVLENDKQAQYKMERDINRKKISGQIK